MKIIINPDLKFAKEIQNKIKENNGYCPCKISKTDDTKCMCVEFKNMIKTQQSGMCHCGLYIAQQD